jgi:F-type H+-transporting ATPase subunit a
MKPIFKYLLLCALLAFALMVPSQKVCAAEKINATELVMEHTADAHDWHITTINGKPISIPLPVIIKTSKGWQFFMSGQLESKCKELGLTMKEGKIYENGKRVVDFSMTKDVVQLWIVVALLLIIFLSCAHWYKNKKPSDDAPKGFVGLMEMMTMFIYDDIIKETIPEKHIHRYAPFLLTSFFFIFLSNIMGLIPIFPGGANLTGNIAITFFLALCTMLLVNLFGNKHYWKDIFWPDVPWWLKVPVPIIPVIELFGVFTKPFALMIRLFANIFGGHAVAISLTCVIFITFQKGIGTGASVGTVSFLLMIFMDFLELLVAFIQAFVFTMLSSVFIGLAHQGEEETDKKVLETK